MITKYINLAANPNFLLQGICELSPNIKDRSFQFSKFVPSPSPRPLRHQKRSRKIKGNSNRELNREVMQIGKRYQSYSIDLNILRAVIKENKSVKDKKQTWLDNN